VITQTQLVNVWYKKVKNYSVYPKYKYHGTRSMIGVNCL